MMKTHMDWEFMPAPIVKQEQKNFQIAAWRFKTFKTVHFQPAPKKKEKSKAETMEVIIQVDQYREVMQFMYQRTQWNF